MSSFGKQKNQCVIHSPLFPFQNKAPVGKKEEEKKNINEMNRTLQ